MASRGASDRDEEEEEEEVWELDASVAMGTSMERGRLGYTWGVIAAGGRNRIINRKHGLKMKPETSNKQWVKVSRGVGGCLINLN